MKYNSLIDIIKIENTVLLTNALNNENVDVETCNYALQFAAIYKFHKALSVIMEDGRADPTYGNYCAICDDLEHSDGNYSIFDKYCSDDVMRKAREEYEKMKREEECFIEDYNERIQEYNYEHPEDYTDAFEKQEYDTRDARY